MQLVLVLAAVVGSFSFIETQDNSLVDNLNDDTLIAGAESQQVAAVATHDLETAEGLSRKIIDTNKKLCKLINA